MARRITTFVATLALAVATLTPGIAAAREHGHGGGYYGGDYGGHGRHGGYDRDYYGDRGRDNYRRHDDDDGDALAAGVIGLALGAIIGSAVTSNNQSQRYYQPAPRAYYPPPPPRGYYGGPGYAAGPPVCVLRERQWDPYAGQYVRVERRVPC